MITKIKITFDPTDKVLPRPILAPLFQGALMDLVPEGFAEMMHVSMLRPYSQFVTSDGDSVVWTVTALDEYAQKFIIDTLSDSDFKSVTLTHKDATLKVRKKEISHISYSELLDKYYIRRESNRYITLKFITPTAFKSNGKYIIMPDSSLILNNLVRKYDSVAKTTQLYDETLIEYINSHTEIVEYNLRSCKYAMEGITIPSFTGTAKIKLGGNHEFICLCNMLLDFAGYSGIGIKSAMGMGACGIINTGGAI
ncbi:MAG: CRISPR-associated endoribonuclease Cas6 [Ruminococcus sp.]|nr:CRISPR-associated endoribonuclease Cas6 [Ruminococcus sp.]MBP1566153.1 CRISPR-associated endoribonuclease Cas6 [Oscillospiraceae bacterium]